jgi:hypothetical protein
MDVKRNKKCICCCGFISSDWEARHVTIGLFEVSNMNIGTMVFKLQELLDKFFLTWKILAFVKDERSKCLDFYYVMQ